MRRTRSNRPPRFCVDIAEKGTVSVRGHRTAEALSEIHQIGTGAIPSVVDLVVTVVAMDAAAIRAITVFSDLDESQCECVAGACQELDVDVGTTLTAEGDFGYALFAVVSGSADVYKNGSQIRTLGPGDVFGEIAVLFGGRRTATVVATTPMRLVMLFNRELVRLDRDVPEVADALRVTVAARLDAA
jgi:CRP-like cAMP-binding protein